MRELTIRTSTFLEVEMAVDWAANEGWNPGIHDAASFYTTDTSGFFIGALDNVPVATISAVKYGKSFGFIGFFIVLPEYRGIMQYGVQLGLHAITSLEGRVIGVDGVVAKQGIYKKAGFQLAYRNIRFQSLGAGKKVLDPNLIPLSEIPFEAVLRYDQPFFPDERATFLRAWITQPDSVSLGLTADQELAGYGVLRKCRIGWKIGPLFADTPEYAERLFQGLKSFVDQDEPFYLDIPETNVEALNLVERHGMTPVFETGRMYIGNVPQLPLNRLYGVTTFELG